MITSFELDTILLLDILCRGKVSINIDLRLHHIHHQYSCDVHTLLAIDPGLMVFLPMAHHTVSRDLFRHDYRSA